MHESNIAKILIMIGILLIVAGGLYYFFGDAFKWFGKLPGDIRIENDNTKIFIPLTSMLLLSLLLNIIWRIIQYFLK